MIAVALGTCAGIVFAVLMLIGRSPNQLTPTDLVRQRTLLICAVVAGMLLGVTLLTAGFIIGHRSSPPACGPASSGVREPAPRIIT